MSASILLVEDNRDEVDLMLEAIRGVDASLVLHVVGDLATAWTWLSEVPVDNVPCLLITDHHLPDGYGQELIARLRANTNLRTVRMAMVSGDIRQPNDLGGAVWYGKPDTWAGWCRLAQDLVQLARR